MWFGGPGGAAAGAGGAGPGGGRADLTGTLDVGFGALTAAAIQSVKRGGMLGSMQGGRAVYKVRSGNKQRAFVRWLHQRNRCGTHYEVNGKKRMLVQRTGREGEEES